MATISKPQTVNFSCYELGHTWTPSCKRASIDVAILVAKSAFKIYGTLFLIAGIVRRRGKSYFKKKIWQEIAQSTLFLTTNGTVFIACFCLWRRLAGFYFYLNAIVCGIPASALSLAIERKERKLLGPFKQKNMFAFVPAAIGSFTAILIERKSRRGLLAVYMANVALETLWRMFEARGWVRSIPNGEVLLFSVASAVFLYYFKLPNGLPEGTLSIFKRVLGSEEAPLIKTGETAESNDVVEPSARTGTGTNGIPRTTRKTRQNVYQKAIQWLQQAPSHPTCRHKHSCIFYVLQGAVKMFGAGYVIQAAIKLVSSMGNVMKQPKSVIQALFNWNNTKLGAFLASFVGLYRGINCLLRWIRKKDESIHGLAAGFIAGWSMMFYKGPTLALYTATKLLEMLYFKGIDLGKLPYIGCADIIIYSISTALVFHAAVLEPHNLRPAYWKFLLRVTGGKFATMNRKLLDPLVPNCSKINPDYWPDYDPRYSKLAR